MRRAWRVFLRPPTGGDREEVLRLSRASRRLHRGPTSPPVTARQFAAYLERRRRPDSPGFLICRTVDGAIVGGINVGEIVRGNFRSAYLGYQIGAPFAGRGYMTEALQLALAVAFGRPGLHRVEANIQPGNHAFDAPVSAARVSPAATSRSAGAGATTSVGTLLAEDWRAPRLARRRSAGRRET